MIVQENKFAHAYLIYGESKFEDLRVIFAPAAREAAREVIEVSSNNNTQYSRSVVVLSSTETEAPDDNGVVVISRNHDDSSHYDIGALMDIEHIGDEELQAAEPWIEGLNDGAMYDEAMYDDASLVPFEVQEPINAVPVQVIPPLDRIEISAASSQSSQFAWWDYINVTFEESDGSSATDMSTGHSVNNGSNNGRCMRKKKSAHKEHDGRLTSTSSNSLSAHPN